MLISSELQVQFQSVKSNDVAQFKDISIQMSLNDEKLGDYIRANTFTTVQMVVAPTEYESDKLIYPYEKALASIP